MHGGSWSSGSGAGGFGIGMSGHSAGSIGSRAASPEFHAAKATWREFFRKMVDVAGFILAFLGLMFLAMAMNERYGIVPVLLTIIIVLMVFSGRNGHE